MNLDVLYKSIAWVKAKELAKDAYELTKVFPKEETYVFVSQIRRSATSVPFNIAEGKFRESRKEFAHYLAIAKGSCGELATQMILAYELGYVKKGDLEKISAQIIELIKILQASIKTLKSR